MQWTQNKQNNCWKKFLKIWYTLKKKKTKHASSLISVVIKWITLQDPLPRRTPACCKANPNSANYSWYVLSAVLIVMKCFAQKHNILLHKYKVQKFLIQSEWLRVYVSIHKYLCILWIYINLVEKTQEKFNSIYTILMSNFPSLHGSEFVFAVFLPVTNQTNIFPLYDILLWMTENNIICMTEALVYNIKGYQDNNTHHNW